MNDLAVSVTGLVKNFGSVRAVDGLDLKVRKGEVHGFVGPNGAGKSTTIRVLLGLYGRAAGTVDVLGLDPAEHPALNRRVSYVPGDVTLWPNLTGQQVLDALAGIRGAYDRKAEARLVQAFALDTKRRVRSYSKGNRQKVMLVAAFAACTELLVLDEPTSGLDPLMEQVFQTCVLEAAASGRTVLLSSHILSEVERLCASVTIVRDGRLVESGTVAEMRHLATSRLTGRVPAVEVALLRKSVASWASVDGAINDDGSLDLAVPEGEVRTVLSALLSTGAEGITCTPATLDDLFLRHYAVTPL